MDGALLVDKNAGITSFGAIEELQKMLQEQRGLKRRDLPKIGHGGTLDPFATGLLAVCVGRAVKLARYFLGSTKVYEGVMRFGETTIPGDPTDPVSERSDRLPGSIEELREMAKKLSAQPYLQTPPMHSAKKQGGKPLYELARQGIEVEREPKLCHLYSFEILEFTSPRASFRLGCGSGTYVRTLAQDFSRLLGTVGMLESLRRTGTGGLEGRDSWTLAQIRDAVASGQDWDELPCWVPFDRLLDGYPRAEATREERDALFQGRQNVLFNILKRTREALKPGPSSVGQESCVAVFCEDRLIAVSRRDERGSRAGGSDMDRAVYDAGAWGLERVFIPGR